MTFSRGFFMLFTTACVVGCAWGFVDGLEKLDRVPASPTPLTVDQIHDAKPLPCWVQIEGGVPRCDLAKRSNKHDVVPVIDGAVQEGSSSSPRVLLLALENDELCATLPLPLRVKALHHSAYADAIIADLTMKGSVIVRNDVFELDADAPGTARDNVVIPLGLMLVAIGALLLQVRSLKGVRDGKLAAVGDVGAAPAGGVHAALAHGTAADASDSVFPAAPLLLSTAAETQAWRARHLAPAFLVVCSVAFAVLGGLGGLGVINDLRAWYGGIEVPAEMKGSTSSKLVLSFLDVQLAWQMPGETQVRSANRMFMTLWTPDEDAGAVRALVDHPEVVTFEEAVDLVPLRLPLILAAFGMAFGAAVSARNSRKNADRVRRVAKDAVEGVLQQVTVVENRVNVTVTGYTLAGVLDGRAVSCALGPSPGPDGLIVAGANGGILVARSADGLDFQPLFTTGEPFAWKAADWARAQAILDARGSPTRLVG